MNLHSIIRMPRLRKGFLLMAALCLFCAGSSRAQLPVLPRIPETFPQDIQQALQPRLAPLHVRLDHLVNSGKNLNQRCANFEKGSALEQECLGLQQQWIAERSAIQHDVDTLQAHIGMIGQLVVQDQKLTQQINGNLDAIKNSWLRSPRRGFLRNGTSFPMKAKKEEFADKIKEQAADLIADMAGKGILATTHGLSQEQANKWIALLEKQKIKPDAAIAAVGRMTTNETRAQLAADAGFVVQVLKTGYAGWNAQTREELLNLALDSTCEASHSETFAAQCSLFRSEAKILSAEVYYGSATYVARNQIDALASLTEEQLKALGRSVQFSKGLPNPRPLGSAKQNRASAHRMTARNSRE